MPVNGGHSKVPIPIYNVKFVGVAVLTVVKWWLGLAFKQRNVPRWIGIKM